MIYAMGVGAGAWGAARGEGGPGVGNHKRGGGMMVCAENEGVAKGIPVYRGVIGRWCHRMAPLTAHIGYNAIVSLHSLKLAVRLLFVQAQNAILRDCMSAGTHQAMHECAMQWVSACPGTLECTQCQLRYMQVICSPRCMMIQEGN